MKSPIISLLLVSITSLTLADTTNLSNENWTAYGGTQQLKNGDGTLCWRSGLWTAETSAKNCDGAIQPPAAPIVVIGINQSDRGVELVLPDQVLFAVGKAELNVDASGPYLDRMAELILKKSTKPVLVEGHTDSQGSTAFNQRLSEQRAKVVFDALVARGVPVARMSSQGLAATRPVAPNNLDAGRRLNRRTEVVVLEETVENIMHGEPSNSFEKVADRIKRIMEAGGAQ